MKLNHRWLPHRSAVRSNRSHARTYRSVKAVWKRVSGEQIRFTGLAGHTDALTVKRHLFKNRERYARAKTALRDTGPWRAWYELGRVLAVKE